MLSSRRIAPTRAEVEDPLPGDDLVPRADAVMDRAFTVAGSPVQVWPWLVQLGKQRAGWYLPRTVERLVPPRRRAARVVEDRWQGLRVGDVIPDYGGRDETFEAVVVDEPATLVYRSRRGRMEVSWAIVLRPLAEGRTRVHLRLRLGPVRRQWLVATAGELVDRLTIAGLAAGLDERLAGR